MSEQSSDLPVKPAKTPPPAKQSKPNAEVQTPSETLASVEIGHGFIDGATFRNRPVTYAVIDGRAIFEGDIVLDGRLHPAGSRDVNAPEHAVDIVQSKGVVERAVVITGSNFRWPNGVVPFEIDASMPAAQRTAVTNAINHWQSRSRIGFVPRTAQNAANFPSFIRFAAGNECSSQLGRQGNMQTVTLGTGCFFGQAVHEIGHALGLWHEQSREDRGRFITINWANIDPAQRHNFDQHIVDGDDVGEYDYGSIMHYGPTAFSINGLPTIVPTQAGAMIGQRNGLSAFDTAGIRSIYRSIQPPQDRVWRGDFTGDGRTDLLSYVPSRLNWWLGAWGGAGLGLRDVGSTAGFGQVGDGRPFWVGDFNGDGRDDVLFYYPGDDNWWLGTFNGASLAWSLVGNTRGFGHAISDGRPFWSGKFSRTDAAEILFYYPGDDNWWLGSMANGNLTWSLAGNTRGFGHAINDGRPFWTGDFTGDGRTDILFYNPGDDNWWLGKFNGKSLTWSLAGNTRGFGHGINDGRPFWVADFNGDGKAEVLFYYPGDDNWWLGTFNGTTMSWSPAANTAGFGHRINDGRPFWIDDFNGDGKAEVLFYYPGDDNWWLGTFNGNSMTWSFAGNTAGFGHRINDGRPFWTGRFADRTKASMLFYYPSDGKWWIGTLVNGRFQWSMAGDF